MNAPLFTVHKSSKEPNSNNACNHPPADANTVLDQDQRIEERTLDVSDQENTDKETLTLLFETIAQLQNQITEQNKAINELTQAVLEKDKPIEKVPPKAGKGRKAKRSSFDDKITYVKVGLPLKYTEEVQKEADLENISLSKALSGKLLSL